MREKSGIDAAPFVSSLPGPPPDVPVCPSAGVATAAANAMNGRKFRCLRLPTSLTMVFHEASQGHSHGFGLNVLARRGPPLLRRRDFGTSRLAVPIESCTFFACLWRGAGWLMAEEL